MRTILAVLFVLFLSNVSLGQDLSDSSRYSLITLDGKDAYIDIQTGKIIYPNTVKKVAPAYTEPTYSDAAPAYSGNNQASYSVKRGDTLYSIARKYSMSVNNLASMNGLSTRSQLSVGQRLVVNADSAMRTSYGSSAGSYIVQRGDTLYSIARQFGTSARSIAARNGISTRSTLKVGQRLKIDGAPAAVNGASYRVRKGDTLYSIARSTGVTVYELKSLNGLSSNTLKVGQVLRTR